MSPTFILPHIESSPKRIRVLFAGTYIVDTRKAKLVWEKPSYPTYFFLESDLPTKYLDLKHKDSNGAVYDVVVGSRRAPLAAATFSGDKLAGLVKVTFGAMDSWFEENEQIFVHPKDPYKRVDVLQSSCHVRIEVNGVEVANSCAPRFLYETSLPVRTYLPKVDCRLDLLEPSDLTTQCPYKGEANYYHLRLSPQEKVEDIVWWYFNPTPECAAIRGYIAFYDEKVDVWVDGEKQARPVTHWS